MVPAGRLSHLPSPLRAAFNDCVRDFITIDRGAVRSNNDQSFESRAAHFARFCEDMESSEHYLRGLDWADTLQLLGTYLHSVQRGNNLDKLTDLSAQTMTNYLSAAHRWLEVVQDHSIDIYDPHSSGKGRRYHPFLAQQLADCRSWKKPRSKREPFSMLMFEKLLAEFSASITATLCFFSKAFSVYDWARLGVFTGFRSAEYSQTRVPKGQRFMKIPASTFIPEEFCNTPLAFIPDDFRFYDRNHCLIPHHLVFCRHLKGEILELEICWRYDKSANNFTIRRFCLTSHPIFDPIDAAVSIVHRCHLLKVPSVEQMGEFSTNGSTYRFLRDSDVRKVMQHSVDLAYPDKNHYMQRNKHLIQPHSNRITAGGASNDDIAFKLRWSPTSVPTYLCDCFQGVGDLLQKAIAGVMKMSFS